MTLACYQWGNYVLSERLELDNLTLGWVAGLIEGEGCITDMKSKRAIEVTVAMCDADVIEKLHKSIPGSTMCVGLLPSGKNIYRCRINRRTIVYQLLKLIYPIMGDRRKARIDRALEKMTQPLFNKRKSSIDLEEYYSDLHG